MKSLPARPNLQHLKNEAQAIVRAQRRGEARACAVLGHLRRFAGKAEREILASHVTLAEAQLALAREYGFANWAALKESLEQRGLRQEHSDQKENSMNGVNEAGREALRLPKVGDQSKAVGQLPEVLDDFQVGLVRQALPAGSEIVGLKPVTPIYRYPLLVEARVPGGGTDRVELHAYAWHLDSAEREAALLPVLAEMGLPVAKVLAGPAVHPGYPQVGPMVVQSHLPGEFLPFVRATSEQLDKTCRLMLEGIARLRGLTGALEQHPVGKLLPRRTLVSLLEAIVKHGGPWLEEPVFRRGVEVLGPVLRAVKTPLVFSNGLNISWNFKWDGQTLTGFHRFARACFEDPHIQFAKYKIWAIDDLGWGPFARAGFVERYLYEQNVAKSEFASRLALQCLGRLQEAIPVSGGEEEWGRERESCLALLESSLAML